VVLDVLEELGAQDKPVITVLNKIDLVSDRSWPDVSVRQFPDPVMLSAKTGENLDMLIARIADFFSGLITRAKLVLPHSRMDLVDLLYRQARIKKIDYLQNGIHIDLELPRTLLNKLSQEKGIEIIY
jgi:GTP-binding protein HflX